MPLTSHRSCRSWLLAGAISAASLFALALGTAESHAADADLPPGVVARVYDEDVTETQLFDRLARRYETGEKGREVLEQIVDDACVAKEAADRRVTVSRGELDRYIEKLAKIVKDNSGGRTTMEDVFAETKTTRAEFERTTTEFLLRQKMAAADLGAKEGEDLPEHRIKLWVASVKRKTGVRYQNLPDGVLAQIGETITIDRARFARELATRLPREIIAGIRTELVLDTATRRAVTRSGVTVTDGDIDAQVRRLRERFDKNPNVLSTGVTFDQFLKQTFGIGEAELRKDPTFRARVGLERMLGQGITEDQIKTQWDKNRDAYGERALLRQLLIQGNEGTSAFQGKGQLLTMAQARDAALRAKVAILEKAGMLSTAESGAKKTPLPDALTAVAKELEPEQEHRAQVGEPVAWTRENVAGNTALEQAVFTGEMGTLVGPIRSEIGYHLLVVEQRRPAPTYDECKSSVREDLIRVAIRRFQLSIRGDDQIIFAKD